MKHIIFKITMLSALLFTACKKNDKPERDEKPGNQSYQPMSTGSSWTYKNTNHINGAVDTSTFVMSSETKTVADRVYHILKSKEEQDVYFQNDGTLYRTLQEDIQGNGWITLEYLNVAAPTGTTWTVASGPIYRLKTTILEKNLTKVIYGKNYNEVIHSKIEIQAKNEDEFETELTLDFYCAKGIGMIQTGVSTLIGEISRSELIRANIK